MTKMLSYYAITDDVMPEWDDAFYVDLAEAEAAIHRTLKESEELVVVWPSRPQHRSRALYLERVSVPFTEETLFALLNNKGPLSVFAEREVLNVYYTYGATWLGPGFCS
ncbi:MAG: hypothetical protein NBV76_00295 [Candidatus Ochrobactrum gambitense]|nr:MAG: hypothetical protein NBV76_00295 [Candidatus Ochrobactrum gambitense]WEK15939.1 MAG: hypothetical protein P0Y54_10680 [Candidatus Ochrobactrum gambitense]